MGYNPASSSYLNTQDPYPAAQQQETAYSNQACTASDLVSILKHSSTSVDSLQSDTDGLLKRAYGLRNQIDRIYDLLFGASPEKATQPQEAREPSIHGNIKESYHVLSGIDVRLDALVSRLGGR